MQKVSNGDFGGGGYQIEACEPLAFVCGSGYTPGGTVKYGCCQRSLHCSPPVVELATIFIRALHCIPPGEHSCQPLHGDGTPRSLGQGIPQYPGRKQPG